VVEHPGRALPLDAAKIDQDYLPARSQRRWTEAIVFAGNSK
jgi:hypothetical protein